MKVPPSVAVRGCEEDIQKGKELVTLGDRAGGRMADKLVDLSNTLMKSVWTQLSLSAAAVLG